MTDKPKVTQADERRVPIRLYLGPFSGERHAPLDDEGLRWLADQLCSEGRRVTKKKRPHLPIPNRLYRFLQYAWQRRSADDGPILHIRGKAIKRVDKGFRLAARKVGLDGVSPHTLSHSRYAPSAESG